MFWNDPNLYGVNFRDLPNPMQMNPWGHNIPRFIPTNYGSVPTYYNVVPGLTTPFVRPELAQQAMLPQTPFIRPELAQQAMLPQTPFIRPDVFSQVRPEFAHQAMIPQTPFNPYLNVYGWYRPFGF
jgi:hypothetical protein